MYCKRCGDIVYSDRCKRCGGRPVESTTGAAAAPGERRDPWTSTYLERRFHPSTGSPSASGSSPSARPISTAYPPAQGNEGSYTYSEPSGPYRMTDSPKSGSPVAISGLNNGASPVLKPTANRAAQAAAVAASSGGDNWRDGIPVPRARGLRDSPASRPTSMYASSNTQHSPVQMAAAAQRSAALNGNKPYNISPVLNAGGRYSHYKSPSFTNPSMPAAAPMSASPSSSPGKQMKPRWSQYFTSTATPQAAAAPNTAAPGARMRSETMPAPYTREDAHNDLTGMEHRHEVTSSVYRPSPSQQQQPKSKQQTIAAAAGVEAAGMAHSQLVDQNTRRLSNGVRAEDSTGYAIANRAPATVEREYRTPTATSRYELPGQSCKTPILPSPITSTLSPRQTSSAFDNRRPVMSSRDNQESRADSAIDTSTQFLRSRSATLPDQHVDASETRPCTTCGKALRAEERRQFASKPGVIYCTDCYHSSYSRGFCAGCQKIVLTGGRPWVQYGDKVWHKLCIRCRSCNKMLISPLVDLEGHPICEPCFTKEEPNSAPRFMPKDQTPPAKPVSSIADMKAQTQASGTTSGQRIAIPPRPKIEPAMPSAMGGGIGVTSPAPTSPTSSTREPIYRGYTSSPAARSPLSPTPTKVTSAASIPTPILTQYDRAGSHQSLHGGNVDVSMMTGRFNEMDTGGHNVLERILSPDEVAEKEGLPLPRSIIDPDISAISRSESEATAVSPTHGTRPTSSGSRTSSPQQQQYQLRSSPTPPTPTSSKIDAIKTRLNSAMQQPSEPAQPSSPRSSLKSPNSPTGRSASRSVSFMVDRPPPQPSQLSRQGYGGKYEDDEEDDEDEEESEERTTSSSENEDEVDHEMSDEQNNEAVAGESAESNGTLHEESEEPAELEEEKSLADYVLSKASSSNSGTRKAKSTLPSVADTIKKFSASAFLSESSDGAAADSKRGKAKRQPTVDKSQLPELRDMIRTHHREPPTKPTIPVLEKHSKLLKGRPRNGNRRGPTQSQSQSQPQSKHKDDASPQWPPAVGQSSDSSPEQRSPGNIASSSSEGEADAQAFIPNHCARCSKPIEDTWFRLSDDRQVHVECFTCRGCNQLIEDGVYVLEDGIEYHPPCVPPTPPVVSVSPVPSSRSGSSALPGKPRGPRAPKQEERCDSCQQLLSGPRFQLSNGKRYHPDCFACAGCKQRFDEGSYVCFEGREYHHHCVGKYAQNTSGNGNGRQSAESQLVCGACQNVIEGVFVKHNDSAYHPDCFCCSDCHKVITPRMPFGEIDTRPCCESCLERRFAESQRQQPQPGWSQYPPHAPQQHQQQYQPQPQQQRQHYPAHGGY